MEPDGDFAWLCCMTRGLRFWGEGMLESIGEELVDNQATGYGTFQVQAGVLYLDIQNDSMNRSS